MVKYFSVFFAVWIALAFVGGIADGRIIATGQEDVVGELPQVTVASNPWQGAGYNPVSWFTAPAHWLGNLLAILTLQSSIFNDDWGRLIRWALLGLLVAPIVIEVVRGAVSRGGG